MAEDLISSIIDEGAIQKQLDAVSKRLDGLAGQIKGMPILKLNDSASYKQLTEAAKAYESSLQGVEVTQKKVLDTEKLAAIERKRIADERTQQARQAAADLKLQQIEIKKRQIAEQEAAIASKQAAKEATEAGRERLQQLREEKEALEKAENSRNAAEQQALSGTYNPGGGKGIVKNAPSSQPFIPLGEAQIQAAEQLRLQAAIKSLQDGIKSSTLAFKEGKITQDEYDATVVRNTVAVAKYQASLTNLNKEIKASNAFALTRNDTKAQAEAQNVILRRTVANTPTSDTGKIKELNDLIDKNNQLIDENSDKLSKQKINIGNYPTAFTSAFKTLNTELDNVNKKIAAGASGKELQSLTTKQNALNNAIQATGKDFQTTNAQQGAFKEAAKQLGSVYGTNSALFKSFNKDVGAGAKAIKDVSKEVDAAAGGTAKLTRGFQGIFSVIRNLANLIPGLGLSGVLLLALTPLTALGEAFINLFKALSNGKERVEALNAVNAKSVEIYNKEKTEVEDLAAVAKDNNISLATRQEALKQLIAINPNYLRGLTLENIATAEGAKLLDSYVGSLQKKAELQAASIVQGEANKVVADLQAERQAIIDLGKTGKASFNDLSDAQKKFFDNSTSIGRIAFTASVLNLDLPKSDIDEAIKNIDKEIKKAGFKVTASVDVFKEKFKASFEGAGEKGTVGIIQKLKNQIDELSKIQPTLLNEAAIKSNVAQIKKLQDELDKLLGKEKKTKSPKIKEDIDAAFEVYKIAQQRKIKLFEEEAADEKNSFDKRVDYLNEASTARLELIDKENQEEIRKNIEKQRALESNFSKSKGTEKNNLAIEIQNNATAREVLEAKAADNRLKAFDDHEKKYQEILKSANEQEEKIRKENYDRALKDAEAANIALQAETARQFEDKIEVLNKSFTSGRINEEQYNKRREKLEFDFHTQSIRNELAYAKQILDIQKAAKIDTLKQQEAIQKLAADLEKTIGQKRVKEHLSDLEFAKKKADLYKQLYAEIQQTVFKFLDDGLTRETQDLDERKRLLDEDTKRRINNINQLGLSEVERVKQTSEVEKNAQFQSEQIERRKRAIEVQRAKFEKAASIASIISSTAQAIAGALAQAKTLGYAALPLAALIGAIGALQLARAISTPLPKYRHGRGDGKDEFAVVGDGFKSEYISRHDGSIERTPARPTITYLSAKDRVYPDEHSFQKSLIKSTLGTSTAIINSRANDDANDSSRTLKGMHETLKSIDRKSRIAIYNTSDIKSTAWYQYHFKN